MLSRSTGSPNLPSLNRQIKGGKIGFTEEETRCFISLPVHDCLPSVSSSNQTVCKIFLEGKFKYPKKMPCRHLDFYLLLKANGNRLPQME